MRNERGGMQRRGETERQREKGREETGGEGGQGSHRLGPPVRSTGPGMEVGLINTRVHE